jgi:hypothetical protein
VAEYVTIDDVLYFVFRFSVDDNGFGWGKLLARHRVSMERL